MKYRFHTLLALCATLGAWSVQAYVPPSFFIVRSLAKKHALLEEKAQFRHKIRVYKGDEELLKTFSEVVTKTGNDQLTIQISDDTGSEIARHSRRLMAPNSPVLYDLLINKDAASIYDRFKALGLPLKTEADLYSEKEDALPYKPESTVNLFRHENRVAVVLANASNKSELTNNMPQLWVEKDSYLPVRAILPATVESGAAPEQLEFRFSGYQIHKGFLYPRLVQVFKDSKLWIKIETQDVRFGNLKELSQNDTATSTKDNLDGDTERFLENYLKWVR